MKAPEHDNDPFFYQDAFTSISSWDQRFFDDDCKKHGIIPEEDEWFGLTARRLWDAYTEEEKAEFKANYDSWLNANNICQRGLNMKWIGPSEYKVGDFGFLIQVENQFDGFETWALNDTPAHTNQSREPRLFGWCGSYNNTSYHAHGVWKVTRVAKNGRAQIVELTGNERTAALEELGYPELDDQ